MKKLTNLLVFVSLCITHYSFSQDVIFWGSQTTNLLYSSQELNGNVSTLNTGQTSIRRIRVDPINSQIYWAIGGSNTIRRANLDGSNQQDVITTAIDVGTIAVYPEINSLYYYSNVTAEFRVSNLDGTNDRLLFNLTGNVLGIGFDKINNQIYWSETLSNGSEFKRANLPLGDNVSTVFTSADDLFDIYVSGEDSTIYFTNRTGQLVQKVDFNGNNLQTLTSETSSDAIGAIDGNFCTNELYYALRNNNGTGVRIRKTDLDGTNFTTILDTTFNQIAGIGVLFDNTSISTDSFLGNDTTICSGDSINFDLGFPGFTYLWSDGSSNPTFTIDTAGIFWVEVQNGGGTCPVRDSIVVNLNPTPSFTLGNDTTLCSNDSLRVMNPQGNYEYLWNTGESSPNIALQSSGIYWVNARLGNCSFTDSINVIVTPAPSISLGPDTALCIGDTLTLDAFSPSSTYLWNTGSVDSAIRVTTTDNYQVSVTQNTCETVESIQVDFIDNSTFSLGSDTILCSGESIVLSSNVPSNTFLWQDASTNNTFTVINEGSYYLTIQNQCGTASDTIQVTSSNCNNCELEIPTVFTPNNDQINDNFKLRTDCQLITYSIQIYNRYGRQVFQSRRINNSWTGRDNGKEVRDGVYQYIVRYQFSENEEPVTKTGSVLIIE